MSPKKKTKRARQVSAPKEREFETVDPAEVDLTEEGDPDLTAPRPGLIPATVKPEDKRISSAAVVEPTAVDEDDKGIREEKVMATRAGYYGHKRREPGEVFIMYFKGKRGFLPSWVRLAEDEDIQTRKVETKPGSGKFEDEQVLNNARSLTEQGGTNVAPDLKRTVI